MGAFGACIEGISCPGPGYAGILCADPINAGNTSGRSFKHRSTDNTFVFGKLFYRINAGFNRLGGQNVRIKFEGPVTKSVVRPTGLGCGEFNVWVKPGATPSTNPTVIHVPGDIPPGRYKVTFEYPAV